MTASIWNPGSSTTTSTPATVPFSFVKGTEANPGINFVGDTDTGIWSQADGYLNFVVNGVSKLSISPTGEVTANEFVTGVEIDVASAATVDIGAVQSNSIRITGTSTITSFGTTYQGPKFIRFAGALTLTNSSTLICPGGSNISISAGDTMIVVPKATAGVSDGWAIISYIKSVAATDLSNTVRVDVASAATTSILYTSIGSRNIRLTGTTPISTFTADAGGLYFVTFAGSITLTNSASIVTNIGGDIQAKAGDTCILRATAYSVVEVISYVPAALGSISQGGQLAGFRNKLINGAFQIWQRGTSFVSPANIYTADRWFVGATATTVSQTGGFVGQSQSLCLLTATNAINQTLLTQALESTSTYEIRGNTVTISCKYSASVTQPASSLTLSLQKNATADVQSSGTWSTISSASFTPTTTQQTATLTVAIPSDASTVGLRVVISTTNLTNGSNTYIGQAQLEIGTVATPFEQRSYGAELALCQRYLPVIKANSNINGYCPSTTAAYAAFSYPVMPRTPPTGISTGGTGFAYDAATSIALTGLSFISATLTACAIQANVASGLTAKSGTWVLTTSDILFTGCELL